MSEETMPVPDGKHWEKDPVTGVVREINREYKPASYLPGATIIPSHKGKFGAQYRPEGEDSNPRAPMKMVVDPDYHDSYVVDPLAMDRQTLHDAIRNHADKGLRRVYAEAAKGGEVTVEKQQALGQTPAGGSQKKTPKAGTVQRTGVPKGVRSPNKPSTLVAAASAGSPGDVATQPTAERHIAAQAAADRDFMLSEAEVHELRGMMQRLRINSMLSEEVEEETTCDARGGVEPPAEEPERAEAEGDSPAPPRIEVTFSSPTLGTVIGRFHLASVQNGLIILVYDTTFALGTRFVPPASRDSGLQVTINDPALEQPVTLMALYAGVTFKLESLDYLILFVDTRPVQEAAE